MKTTALHYAAAAKSLAAAARRLDLVAPAFRTPPRRHGAQRTLRRSSSGEPTVAVVVRGRPWPAVLADMVEGVVVGNDLDGEAADTARTALWSALVTAGLVDPGPAPTRAAGNGHVLPARGRRVRVVPSPASLDGPRSSAA